MDKFDNDKYRMSAEKFKALGHPIRLWIAHQLMGGEHCVHELAELTDLDFSTISQHLTALRHTGVLEGEKRGKLVFYRLRCKCVRKYLECMEEHMSMGDCAKS